MRVSQNSLKEGILLWLEQGPRYYVPYNGWGPAGPATPAALNPIYSHGLQGKSEMSERTLFQRIADREIPADIVFEDEKCIAFRDINPMAPVHILVVPRKPIPSLDDLDSGDEALVGHLFFVARDLAAREGLSRGYRTVFNCGDEGGQAVYHLHLHLLGGRQMAWPPG